MEKIYKSRICRIIFNFLCGAALSFFVFYIAQIWLTQLTSIIITILVFLSYIWLVIWGNFITIIINDRELIVKNGKKEDRYEFTKYYFRARTVSSRGDTECSLYAIDDNHPMTSFMEGFKQGFYLAPGKHRITSSFEKIRPGFFSKTVTTKYGSTTQEVEVEAEKTYEYSFDKKNEQYTFTEIN